MPNPNEPLREKIHRILTSFETTVLATRGSSYHRAYARNEVVTDLEQLIVDDKRAWEDMLDRAAAGEVVKVTRNGVELTINSLDGMRDGMERVVDSALTLGLELGRIKKENRIDGFKEEVKEL